MLGNPHGDINIPREIYDKFMRKEATILGVFNSVYKLAPHDEWKDAALAIHSGKLKVADLITHSVPIEELNDALDMMYHNSQSFSKVMMVN